MFISNSLPIDPRYHRLFTRIKVVLIFPAFLGSSGKLGSAYCGHHRYEEESRDYQRPNDLRSVITAACVIVWLLLAMWSEVKGYLFKVFCFVISSHMLFAAVHEVCLQGPAQKLASVCLSLNQWNGTAHSGQQTYQIQVREFQLYLYMNHYFSTFTTNRTVFTGNMSVSLIGHV